MKTFKREIIIISNVLANSLVYSSLGWIWVYSFKKRRKRNCKNIFILAMIVNGKFNILF